MPLPPRKALVNYTEVDDEPAENLDVANQNITVQCKSKKRKLSASFNDSIISNLDFKNDSSDYPIKRGRYEDLDHSQGSMTTGEINIVTSTPRTTSSVKRALFFNLEESIDQEQQKGQVANEISLLEIPHLTSTSFLQIPPKINLNKYGATLLHWAAFTGQLEVVKCIVDIDKELLNKGDNRDATPLHWAAFNGELEVVKYMVGRDKELLNLKENKYGAIPLHWAAFDGQLEVVKYMVGIDKELLNKGDNKGATLLHRAAQNGQLEVVKYMVGIDKELLNKGDNRGNIPLNWAALTGQLEVVRYMMDVDPALFLLDSKRFDSKDSPEKVKQAMASDNGTSNPIGIETTSSTINVPSNSVEVISVSVTRLKQNNFSAN